MNAWPELDRFLQTDPHDVGCAEAMEMLSVYVDLVASGAPAEQRYPGIAAHLHACGPCGDDFEALLDAVRDTADSQAPGQAEQDRPALAIERADGGRETTVRSA
jgi:hypothetical protein